MGIFNFRWKKEFVLGAVAVLFLLIISGLNGYLWWRAKEPVAPDLPREGLKKVGSEEHKLSFFVPEKTETQFEDGDNPTWSVADFEENPQVDISLSEQGVEDARDNYPEAEFNQFTVKGYQGWYADFVSEDESAHRRLYIIERPGEKNLWVLVYISNLSGSEDAVQLIREIIQSIDLDGN